MKIVTKPWIIIFGQTEGSLKGNGRIAGGFQPPVRSSQFASPEGTTYQGMFELVDLIYDFRLF
jgi:hypothetical protein